MNANILLLIIRCIGLVVIILILLFRYTSNEIKEENATINYDLVDIDHHRGGRGSYYTIAVTYDEKQYEVGITSKMVREFQNKNTKPELYYNTYFDIVFSDWSITRSSRAAMILGGLILLRFIPQKWFAT